MRLSSATLFAFGLSFGLALGACSSGQTGSPDCVGAMSCICDPLYGSGTLLRVHADSVQTDKLEATVEEVFASGYGPSDVVVGDHVAGSLLAEQPCGPQTGPSAVAGSELLVLFNPDYSPQHVPVLLDGVFSFAVTWGDTLSFGDSKELSSSELAVLSTPESCQQRFPPVPAPPCNDTAGGVACSAAPRGSAVGQSYWAILLGLVALVRGVRRPRLRR